MRRDLGALDGREFDLVVAGGGIQGACVAREAALRGLSVALLERDDFGAATSGNSLGIVHGGLRYLQQGDLPRLRESTRERAAWLRTAPHLVRPVPVLVPAYRGTGRSRPLLSLAAAVDHLLSPDRNRRVPRARRLPAARPVSRREALDLAPWLEPSGLRGGVVFFDARMVHPDRLTLAVVRAAVEAGAVAANHVEVVALVPPGAPVRGVRLRDRLTGADLAVRARLVVDATGPWAGAFGGGAWGRGGPPPLAMAMNVVVTSRLAGRGCAVGLATGSGRLCFVVPWQDRSAVGTGYWPYDARAGEARPGATEVRRFLDDLGAAFGGRRLEEGEVTRVLSGLLPCDAPTGALSTCARLVDHGREGGPEGLVSVVGVKYTTARALAERAVDLAAARLGRRALRSRSAWTPLPGGDAGDPDRLARGATAAAPPGLSPAAVRRLVDTRGTGWAEPLAPVGGAPHLAAPLPGPVPLLAAEVVHAIREEMACTLADVVVRRTGLAAAGLPGPETLEACAALAAAELGWDATRVARELAALRAALEGWRGSSPLGPPSWTGPRR